mgnify:CR=1 FL=1
MTEIGSPNSSRGFQMLPICLTNVVLQFLYQNNVVWRWMTLFCHCFFSKFIRFPQFSGNNLVPGPRELFSSPKYLFWTKIQTWLVIMTNNWGHRSSIAITVVLQRHVGKISVFVSYVPILAYPGNDRNRVSKFFQGLPNATHMSH